MVFGVILSMVSLMCYVLWFLSHFAIFLIHYFFVLLIVLCIVSKFMKLKTVNSESISKIFGPDSFPVAYLGSHFDVPENSKASFEYVSLTFSRFIDFSYSIVNIFPQSCSKSCPRIFFSLDLTADNQLVVLDKQTLEKASIHKRISLLNYDEIKGLDVSALHPLGKQFGPQNILTLDALLKVLEPLNVVVVLHATSSNSAFVESLKQAITNHEPMFTKKIIFCCRSPIIIYKVCRFLLKFEFS